MKLVLFFSRGISLSIWHHSGLLERELAIYKKMLSSFKSIAFITYDTDSDLSSIKNLNGFEVLANRWGLPTDLFSLLAPIIYRAKIRHNSIYKTNQINGWWVGGLSKFFYGKPLIVRCGYLLSLDQERKNYSRCRIILTSLLEKWAFRYSDASIVTTPQIKNEVIRRYGLPPEKIRVIPNPIDTDIFCPLPETKEIEGRLGFVGRFSPEKNIKLLLEAVSGLNNTSVLLIGAGELRSELERLASRKGIDVTFCGNVPNYNLPELLNTCQAFVLPSQWEGMPKALLEAMACGLPVIGTNVPGISDLIEHGRTGYLCEPTSKDLHSAIRKVLNDLPLRIKLGKQARNFVVKNYTLEQSVSKELELLLSLIN
ncbi:glycosyltransferase family 4 protein [Thermodesulfobacteriota bacterium]